MKDPTPRMLPVLAEVPPQFWAFLGSVAAAFLASRWRPARQDAANEAATSS